MNPSSTTDVAALKRKAKLDKANQALFESNFAKVLSDPGGRQVIWHILCQTRFLELSYEGNANTNFNEGRRNVGLMIYGNITNVNPQAFLQMQDEAKLREEKRG